MLFKSAQRALTSIPEVKLGIHSIPVSTDVTFLGIHLDPNLTFRSHFQHLKHKTAFGIRALIKLALFFLVRLCQRCIMRSFIVTLITALFHGATRTLVTYHQFNISKISQYALSLLAPCNPMPLCYFARIISCLLIICSSLTYSSYSTSCFIITLRFRSLQLTFCRIKI